MTFMNKGTLKMFLLRHRSSLFCGKKNTVSKQLPHFFVDSALTSAA